MKLIKTIANRILVGVFSCAMVACAPADIPGTHSIDIPPVTKAAGKLKALNDNNDGVTYLPLGADVLVPKALESDPLPDIYVGPYELRSETLGGALQLVLADFDISMAFESERGLSERVTVANLSGRLPSVVERLCSLANLYCAYKDGLLTIKETETFVVDLPPIGDDGSFGQIVTGLTNILATSGGDGDATATVPVIDTTTRVLVYQASNRTARNAEEYFKRLRKNTAMIVFETHIWEVALSNDNRTGINWTAMLDDIGNFDLALSLAGNAATGGATPITITPSFDGSSRLTSTQVFNFISERGAVKTVSQPQLTMLSGSQATLTVQNSNNFVSEVTRTVDENGDDSFSTETDTVETGLSLTISSAWDEATVYGVIEVSLDDLLSLDDFPTADGGTIQLPNVTNRSLNTQIRVRPGDAVIIAGLVSESDQFSGSGPGFFAPLINTSRAALTENSELVFMLRPRVIVFDPDTEAFKRGRDQQRTYQDHLQPKMDVGTQMKTNDNDQSLGGVSLDALAPVSLSSGQSGQ